VGLAALLIGGALLGPWALTAASLAPMAAMIGGWAWLLALPTPRGTTWVLALSAAAVVAVAAFARDAELTWFPAALALGVLLEFGHQLLRRDARPRLVESMSASVTGIVLLSSGASLTAALQHPSGRPAVVVVLSAVVLAALSDAYVVLGWPAWVGAASSAAFGAAGAAGAAALTGLRLPTAVAVGAFAGLSSYAIRYVQGGLPRLTRPRAQLASAAGSVLAVGLLAHLLLLLPG
jgi:hypothetical protein